MARNQNNNLVEASRDLETSDYACPTCASPVLLKRGRVKVPHFAHIPAAECWSEAESVSHLRAKRLLADRLRAQGNQVVLEEVHAQNERRVDIAVTGRHGHRLAIEIQDSSISVDIAKARTKLDRRLGFLTTLWVFTDKRAKALLDIALDEPSEEYGIECRVPNEMLWVDRRFGVGIFVLDVNEESMWRLQLHPAMTRYQYDEYGDEHTYNPRTLRRITKSRAHFTLRMLRGRYPGEVAATFAPQAA